LDCITFGDIFVQKHVHNGRFPFYDMDHIDPPMEGGPGSVGGISMNGHRLLWGALLESMGLGLMRSVLVLEPLLEFSTTTGTGGAVGLPILGIPLWVVGNNTKHGAKAGPIPADPPSAPARLSAINFPGQASY
jgi:hypothetical protein